jgi:hypothetical protein
MTTTVVEAPTDDITALEQEMALIACGTRAGKSKACDRHQQKGEALLNIAAQGAVDALAATICGSDRRRACGQCVGKAVEMIHVYNREAS